MRPTLFFIPHEIGGVEVFGVGWILYAWIGFGILVLVRSLRRGKIATEAVGFLPVWAFVAAAIVFVIPSIEQSIGAGDLVLPSVPATTGLPIRGYGMMMLLAVIAGVVLASMRAIRVGLNAEIIVGLAFYMFVGGILGARVFFVVQYWDSLQAQTFVKTLANLVNFVEGGLVVYGSLIGAAAGFSIFAWRQRLPQLALADLIAPSLVLGLAIGRIGCLLNGCCFGGLCHLPWSVTFPHGSPPYMHQQSLGWMHGIRLAENYGDIIVSDIDSDNEALSDVHLGVGQRVVGINGEAVRSLSEAGEILLKSDESVTLNIEDGRSVTWMIPELRKRSFPVHPTQIYSSINAAILCLFIVACYPFRRRNGQVITLLLMLYPLTRFLLEIIRQDEVAFAANMTISQNVSILMVVAVSALAVYVWRQPLLDDESRNRPFAQIPA